MNKRDINMDLLRIVASFMVVFLHVSALNFYSYETTSLTFQMHNVYDSLVRAAVPLFLMISGAFLLNNKHNLDLEKLFKKNIVKLIIIFVVWSIIYALCDIFIFYPGSYSKGKILKMLIKGPTHFWYIPAIVIIYALTPFFIRIPREDDTKLARYFLGLFFGGSLLYTLTQLPIPYDKYLTTIASHLDLNLFVQYFNFFLLGYFLYNTKVLDKYRYYFYGLGIGSFIVCVIGTYYLSLNTPNVVLYDKFTILTIFEAIAIFLFFKNSKLKLVQKYGDKISFVAKHTLGIYIIHYLIFNLLNQFTILNVDRYSAVISIPILAFVTFLISFAITYLLKKIKIVNKYLL